MSVTGGIASVLADGCQLLSLDKDSNDVRLLSKAELTEIKQFENEVIVISKVNVSDVKLTPQGGTAISSLGKAAITPGTKTFTITATAADWLKTLVKDGRAEYTLTALVFRGNERLWKDTDYTVTTGADSDGNPSINVNLTKAPAASDVYSITAFVKPVAKGTENRLCDSAYGSWTLTTEEKKTSIDSVTLDMSGKLMEGATSSTAPKSPPRETVSVPPRVGTSPIRQRQAVSTARP